MSEIFEAGFVDMWPLFMFFIYAMGFLMWAYCEALIAMCGAQKRHMETNLAFYKARAARTAMGENDE